MLVKYGAQERALAAQRSRQVRLFRRFETLTTYLKEIGIERFEVDAVDYDPALPKTARRPDFFRRTHAGLPMTPGFVRKCRPVSTIPGLVWTTKPCSTFCPAEGSSAAQPAATPWAW